MTAAETRNKKLAQNFEGFGYLLIVGSIMMRCLNLFLRYPLSALSSHLPAPAKAALSDVYPLTMAGLSPSLLMLLTSVLLVVGAWCLAISRTLYARDQRRLIFHGFEGRLSLTLVIAITLWLVGDAMFSQRLLSGGAALLTGMVSYGIGHFIMAQFFYRAATARPLPRIRLFLPIVLGLLAFVTTWWLVIFRGGVSPAYLVGSFAYGCLLLAFVSGAWAAALSFRLRVVWMLLALGASSFFLGDLLCAVVIFNPSLAAQLSLQTVPYDLIAVFFGGAQILYSLTLSLLKPGAAS